MGASYYVQLFNTSLNLLEAILLTVIVYEKWLSNQITIEKQDSINKRLDKLLDITQRNGNSIDQKDTSDGTNSGTSTKKKSSGS